MGIDDIVASARNDKRPVSLAILELSQCEGRLGQAALSPGGQALSWALSKLEESLGANDVLVGKQGQELFVVLDGPASETERRCEGFCHALCGMSGMPPGSPRLSCAAGIAHFPDDSSDTEGLVAMSRQALMSCKQEGACVVAWPDRRIPEPKRDVQSVAERNRLVRNIAQALAEREAFLVIGHKDPDEDCVSSMVAFALLAVKFGKKASVVLCPRHGEHFSYLLSICRFNGVGVIGTGDLPDCDTLVLVDTPKPELIDWGERYDGLRKDPRVLKVELDHHIGADSRYFGDRGYRLVYAASSTCETIGFLALKLQADSELMERFQIDELLTRNLVLAIISGMISDSQMGKFLKTKREKWFYARFSAMFEALLAKKTRRGSGNFASKEEVYDALVSLSRNEDDCFKAMAGKTSHGRGVDFAVLDEAESARLFSAYGQETMVTVSKALVDRLAEATGRIGIVGYFDDPGLSSFVQFRMRRSQGYEGIDLRDALSRIGVVNGGGHPGAVGFRVEKATVRDIDALARSYIELLAAMMDASAG